ncbi:hypothetical protein HPB52_006205 [Rhipicephalus sanguineus]|uniref:Nlr family card domain protein n=1 Tax=Rhipicephalus sanguineus TaxID=34632 RepID=A0A9D4PNX0_RHISA|nr:hypothetical protein HPB52_006205 [Rhipicephalus sanguineus]
MSGYTRLRDKRRHPFTEADIYQCISSTASVDQLKAVQGACKAVRRPLTPSPVSGLLGVPPQDSIKVETRPAPVFLQAEAMEKLSAEEEQGPLVALEDKIDSTSFFDREDAENFRLPCTAATRPTATDSDRVCPINDHLPICNELLFHVGMELREKRGGSLSLVCFRPTEPNVMPPRDADMHRSNTFLRWLLRTHVCIDGLKLQCRCLTAHSHIFLEELPDNSRLKRLKVLCPCGDNVQTHLAALLPRLRCLKELYCHVSPSRDVLVAAISAFLRNTTCLTSLVFQACFENNQPPQTFIDALATNTTLKYLEMWANWNTAEPPGRLGAYVKSNGLLTNLNLFGEETDREEFLLEEALVCNSTLSTLRIGRLCGGERTVRFLTRILTECTGLKKLTLGGLRDEYVNISEATLSRCVDSMAENDTLDELELSYSLWHPTNWVAFFAFLPKNKHLKKLEVYTMLHGDYETHPPVLEALAQTDSSGRVSFGSYTHKTAEVGLMRFRAFSGVQIYGETNVRVNALQRLPSLDHFTSVTIAPFETDQRLLYSAAKYIRATTVLRKLSLLVIDPAGDAPSSCWELLFESISSNRSITDLCISGSDNFSYAGHVARTVALSRRITRASYSECRDKWNPNGFLLPLSKAIGENYNLLKFRLSFFAKMDAEARCCWFTIREATRRNSGLVELASAFNQTAALDWYTANAMEKVSGNAALVRELAEKEGIAADEVARMLRSRLMSIDGMHDFMRLTGVVKESVTCAPPVDVCSFQLQDLNNDCWRLVRRYLSFDDVKRFTVGKPDDTNAS